MIAPNLSVKDVIRVVSDACKTSTQEVLPCLEPFMAYGSITPVYDTTGKHLMPKLTENAQFLPTASINDMEAFIIAHSKLSDKCSLLLRAIERKLKCDISNFNLSSDYWHCNPVNFSRDNENNFSRFQDLIVSHADFYGNADNMSSAEVISILSFADLSKAYYWFGNPLLNEKRVIARSFGIAKPDIFSRGLRALSNLRNLDAHFLPSFRESIDKPFSAKQGDVMIFPWISTKCNLGKYYGKLCFLVYITSQFSDEEFQRARKEIKSLLQQMPRMTVNYLGIPSGWLDEPLWANI